MTELKTNICFAIVKPLSDGEGGSSAMRVTGDNSILFATGADRCMEGGV